MKKQNKNKKPSCRYNKLN